MRMSMKCVPKPSDARFKLPAWPTTTIGSFPQTTEIHCPASGFQKGNLGVATARALQEHIRQAIVERNVWDWMCWYMARPSVMTWWNTLAEHLDGFVFTQNGWVQSYGSAA